MPKVRTKYRTIKTKLPVPLSLPIFRSLMASEPESKRGQPPVVWDRAEGFQVYDKWGNKWIDFSSGVLVANAGHGRKEIIGAITKALGRGMLTTFAFVHENRMKLTQELQRMSPDPSNYQAALFSGGSEAVEYAIKLAKTHGIEKYGPKRVYIVSFINAFHGSTLGSQLAGGKEKLKKWTIGEGKTFVQVPFPDGYKNKNTSFNLFLESLKVLNIKPEQIAGVIVESYQGGGPDFMPVKYAKELQNFCNSNDIVMIFDEMQSGFGRTGKWFAYEYYGVSPDLITCGKGISSSLPLSAVIGRKDIMALYPAGATLTTHSGNPICVAAALENIKILKKEKLVEKSKKLGKILLKGLQRIQKRYSKVLGVVQGRGLVAGIQVVKPGTREPDGELALRINEACFHKGLLMFSPAGVAGECVKIAPPLVISEEALREGIQVLEEVCGEILG
ncbi:MAG: aspartate aminotransferase family protein [Candidatus Vogelbacteria bacterium]|nr:aspartate aminotransferase family protein [Candidatus Vogelbacteria bacterium]